MEKFLETIVGVQGKLIENAGLVAKILRKIMWIVFLNSILLIILLVKK